MPGLTRAAAEDASLRLLFVTWDAPELSYLESLFLPIFSALRADGIQTDVLQFRWGSRTLTDQVGRICADAGSGYRASPILRRFGGAGALATVLTGALAVRRAVRRFGTDVIMPRSLMPAIATLAAGGSSLRPVIFDADGLAADERVDFAGLSPRGMTYRLLRDAEAQMIRHSRSVLVRSECARNVLIARAGPPIRPGIFHMVTNGRDDRRFTPGDAAGRAATRRALGIADEVPLVAYAGSVGNQYRFGDMALLFTAILQRRPDARFLVLSGAPDRARAALGLDAALASATLCRAVPPDEVPAFLAAADLGVAYRLPSFSSAGVAPIKLSEYLLCGLPVVGTASVGDARPAVDAGVFLDEAAGPAAAALWFADEVLPAREDYRKRARMVGVDHFSLGRTVEAYKRAITSAAAVPTAKPVTGFDTR